MNKLSPKIHYNCKSCNYGLEENNIPQIILSKPKEKTTKVTTFYPKKYQKKNNSLF